MSRTSIPFLLAALVASGIAATAATESTLLTGDLRPNSAKQSSRYQPSGTDASEFGYADLALTNTTLPFAFHTNAEKGAWWAVDLGSPCLLDYARITNRTDCCQERADSLEVYVSQAPFTSDPSTWQAAEKVYPISGSSAGASGIPEKIELLPSIGRAMSFVQYRYVGLRLADNNYLHLKKVEIYGWK